MKKENSILALIVCVVIVYGIAYLGSIFTMNETEGEWYNSVRPSITPPNWVFPIVWNILFLLIAISLWLSWTNAKKGKMKVAGWYGANLILNLTWSILYFGLHNPLLAFIDIILLLITIIGMMIVSYKINKIASYLLIPYLLWVSFASILNYLSI